MNLDKLTGVFDVFSCVGFRLAHVGPRGEPTEAYPLGLPALELHATGAYRGAPEAWNAFGRMHNDVCANIEHNGGSWLLDVIANAQGGGRYDAWHSERFATLGEAYRAMEWLSRDDWAALRSKPAERNTGRRLTADERKAFEAYVGEA